MANPGHDGGRGASSAGRRWCRGRVLRKARTTRAWRGDHRDGHRQTTAAGELTHYVRARENIEALLESLETVAQRPENGGRLPPQVQVRFGHATHTTPAQAARMRSWRVWWK